MLPGEWLRMIDSAAANAIDRDRLWVGSARRGRWVVVERGYPRRGRRFSSLSRARRFARRVGGVVRRWRSREWRRLDPWQHAIKRTRAAHVLLLGAP